MKTKGTKKIPLWLMLLALLTMVVALFSMAHNVNASGDVASFAKVYVDPSVYTAVASGEIFTVKVNIENVLNLGGFELKLRYNATILDALEVVEGSFLGSFGRTIPVKLEKNETLGFVWVAIVLFEPTPAEGDGTLATVSFKSTSAGESSFDLYDTELVDSDGLPIDCDLDCPASYDVIGPPDWSYTFRYVYWVSPREQDPCPLPGGVVDGFCFDKMIGVAGAYVDGQAAAAGWKVGFINSTTVVFSAEDVLTSGEWSGFHIVAPEATDGPVDWFCDHGAGAAEDNDLLHGPNPPSPPPPTCPCDVNFDWIVDIVDLDRVIAHFGQGGPPGWIPEDINKDGTVDMKDIRLVVRCIFRDPAITINQSGVGSDFTGTVVIINGVNYGVDDLPYSFHLCKANYTFTFAFQSPLLVTPEAKQYNWTSTSGLSTLQGETITASESGSIIGNYNAQYYLKVVSPYDISGGEGWYNAGETAYATLQVGLEYADGLAYGFVGWSGDATGWDLLSGPIIMDAPKTAVAKWEASEVYGDVRTVGFWKHQVNVWYFTELKNTGMKIRGIGTPQISEDVLIAYLTFVDSNSDYFKGKIVKDNNGDGAVTNLEILENAYNILETPRGTDSMKMRAEQQLLALWLNLAHETFFWNTQLSQETLYVYCQYNYEDEWGLKTIGESIKWAEAQISSPDGNYEAVKDVCDSINNNLGIIWGT